MTDFMDEIRDELRREKMSKLAKKYGPIAGGAVAALIVMTAAVSWYNHAHMQGQLNASVDYFEAREMQKQADVERAQDLLSSATTPDAVEKAEEKADATETQPKTNSSETPLGETEQAEASALQTTETGAVVRPLKATEQFAKIVGDRVAGYSQLAALEQAATLANVGEHQAAIELYDEIAKDSNYTLEVRELASLQAVSLMVEHAEVTEDNEAQINTRLESLAEANKPWRLSALEMLAFRAYKVGNLQKSFDYFAKITSDQNVPDAMFARATKMGMLIEAEQKNRKPKTVVEK